VVNMPMHRIKKRLLAEDVAILGILRNENFILAEDEIELREDDELYFSCDSANVQKAMEIFGHEEREARRIIIMGGGNIGQFLASHLEQENPDIKVKLIEIDKDRAEQVAISLDRTTVIHGSALSQEILEEANVAIAETAIAVSNDDEVNILASLLAKRFGCQRVVTLINNSGSYSPLTASLGIDVTVNPREITVSSILQHIRKGHIISVHSICKGKAEVLEAVAVESSPFVGKKMQDLALPNGIIIGNIIRDDEVIIPNDDTTIMPADRIIILSQDNCVSKVESTFSVKFEFF